jgi:hypothetical protein
MLDQSDFSPYVPAQFVFFAKKKKNRIWCKCGISMYGSKPLKKDTPLHRFVKELVKSNIFKLFDWQKTETLENSKIVAMHVQKFFQARGIVLCCLRV